MAVSIGMVSGSSWVKKGGLRKKNGVVVCRASPATRLTDQYETLRIQPGASEIEVKKAFRKLALQYHPDVCKGSNCGVQFSRINEAYDIVISNLRGPNREEGYGYENNVDGYDVEPMGGMYDDESSFEMWEEWMGWEGAGIRDYTSHINPYI